MCGPLMSLDRPTCQNVNCICFCFFYIQPRLMRLKFNFLSTPALEICGRQSGRQREADSVVKHHCELVKSSHAPYDQRARQPPQHGHLGKFPRLLTSTGAIQQPPQRSLSCPQDEHLTPMAATTSIWLTSTMSVSLLGFTTVRIPHITVDAYNHLCPCETS